MTLKISTNNVSRYLLFSEQWVELDTYHQTLQSFSRTDNTAYVCGDVF